MEIMCINHGGYIGLSTLGIYRVVRYDIRHKVYWIIDDENKLKPYPHNLFKR